MIEHVSLRCADAGRSRRFYERALKPLGYVCDMEYGDAFGFRDEAGRHDFWVTAGDVGTPTHLAFHAPSAEAIDAFHAAALEEGGKDNGGPGPREGYAAYAAFVHDPDGNNVEAVVWKGDPGAPGRKVTARRTGSRGPARSPSRRGTAGGRGSRPRAASRTARRRAGRPR